MSTLFRKRTKSSKWTVTQLETRVDAEHICSISQTIATLSLVVTGVKVFVDPKAVMYLVGCRMDFVVSPNVWVFFEVIY
jgi:Fe-S cluster assembly iron-binding protein IscA